jgi:hypothetical protein
MEASVSEAAGGVKSILLKPFNFLFRKKRSNAGAILPVRVTGTFGHTRFQVNMR